MEPVADAEELFVGEMGQLKAKLGSTGSMPTIFKVSAFKQPWKLGSHRGTGAGSETFI